MPGFDIDAARKAGYSDTEIADEIGKSGKFNVQGARQSGYNDKDILDEYVKGHSSAAPQQPSPASPQSSGSMYPSITMDSLKQFAKGLKSSLPGVTPTDVVKGGITALARGNNAVNQIKQGNLNPMTALQADPVIGQAIAAPIKTAMNGNPAGALGNVTGVGLQALLLHRMGLGPAPEETPTSQVAAPTAQPASQPPVASRFALAPKEELIGAAKDVAKQALKEVPGVKTAITFGSGLKRVFPGLFGGSPELPAAPTPPPPPTELPLPGGTDRIVIQNGRPMLNQNGKLAPLAPGPIRDAKGRFTSGK